MKIAGQRQRQRDRQSPRDFCGDDRVMLVVEEVGTTVEVIETIIKRKAESAGHKIKARESSLGVL